MWKIPGRLLADIHPNGNLRIVVIASVGGGNEIPFTAESLDAAELYFVRTCGLAPERAATHGMRGTCHILVRRAEYGLCQPDCQGF